MKIKEIKFIHAVKVGAHEVLFASNYQATRSHPIFDIELNESCLFLKLTEMKTKISTLVPLSNVIAFTNYDTGLENANKVRPQDTPDSGIKVENKDRGRQVPKAK